MRTKPTIGQTVWLKHIGLSRGAGRELREAEVVAIGRKYFTVRPKNIKDDWADEKFEIATWLQKSGQYGRTEAVYESVQEHQDEIESYRLADLLRNHFSGQRRTDLSISTMRQILDLLPPLIPHP